MATYDELHTLAGNNTILKKIEVAITIAADTVLNENSATPNHANRLIWAKTAFKDPQGMAKAFQYAVLAANSGNSVAQITGATDAAIQTAVDAAIDTFAG